MNKCFALELRKDKFYCSILKAKKCEGCNFYRTERSLAISRKKAMKRLKSLDKATRLNIAEKYKVEGIVDEK